MAEENSSNGDGPLSDFNPGERVRDAVQNAGPDMSQGVSIKTPENPGPSMLGRTPVLGMLRRERGIPVLRDQLPSLTE